MMSARTVFEISGGTLLILLGVLFMAYLGINPSELATDAIFVGAGILIIRRAFQNRVRGVSRPQANSKSKGKQR